MESELGTSSNLEITPADWQHTPTSLRQALLCLSERVTVLEEAFGCL